MHPRKASFISILLAVAVVLLGSRPVSAQGELVAFGDSDAESIVLLNAFYPGYWWDHTDLTVAVMSAPNVDPALLQAIHDAIGIWTAVLAEQFPTVSLENVTYTARNPHKADIVVHYVPTAGGIQWSGVALCGAHSCPNVMVRSDLPGGWGGGVYDPAFVYQVTLHELGHALGLGHAEPLTETVDLMGYGWIYSGATPILSTCDIQALAVVFEWAVLGVEPYPSSETEVYC